MEKVEGIDSAPIEAHLELQMRPRHPAALGGDHRLPNLCGKVHAGVHHLTLQNRVNARAKAIAEARVARGGPSKHPG